MWLPIVGVVLLVLGLMAVVWRGAHQEIRGDAEVRLVPAPAEAPTAE